MNLVTFYSLRSRSYSNSPRRSDIPSDHGVSIYTWPLSASINLMDGTHYPWLAVPIRVGTEGNYKRFFLCALIWMALAQISLWSVVIENLTRIEDISACSFFRFTRLVQMSRTAWIHTGRSDTHRQLWTWFRSLRWFVEWKRPRTSSSG